MKVKDTNVSIPQVDNYMQDVDIRKMMLKDEVAGGILNMMDQKNISKSELARKMKTSLSNISQILNGHRNLTLDTICEITMALDTDVQVNFADVFDNNENCCGMDYYEQYEDLEGYADSPLAGDCWSNFQENIVCNQGASYGYSY